MGRVTASAPPARNAPRVPRGSRTASPAGAGRMRPGSLGAAYDPRRNAFDVLRLAFAAVVLVTHTTELSSGWQPAVGATDVSALAVDGFFVLSGFLITASWLRLGSLPRFAWHRALRLLPAFWVCLVVTALVVAPLVSVLNGGSATAVFTAPGSALTYVLHNAALYMAQFGVGGVPASAPGDGVINGSLWTLFYEALCYLAVAALGVLGLLRSRTWLVLAGVLALQLATTAEATTGVGVVPGDLLQRLLLMFALGALGFLFARRVPTHPALLVAAALSVLAGMLWFDDYRAVGAPGFALLVLVAAARLPWRPRLRHDLSYGVYIWHWPVAVVLLSTPLAAAPLAVQLAAVVAATTAVAAASWFGVEAPALRLKDVARRTDAQRDRLTAQG